MTRTYSVADNGSVRRLDNLTGPWLDVSVINSFPQAGGALYDVETDPNNSDKVFVVGDGNQPNNLFGIYVSTDAGATWQIPGGNYQTNIDALNNLHWFEIWVLDSNNIFVAGQNGYVAKSTDGGLTFNLCTQFPPLNNCTPLNPCIAVPNVYSVHFITPLVGVVGLHQHAAYTSDGGVSWIILNGGNPLFGTNYSNDITGIHISADQQTIVTCGRNRVFRSIDAGTTWTEVYIWPANNGIHLTWINDSELWIFGSGGERAKSTDAGATWIVLSAYLGGGPVQNAGHFYQGQNGFFNQNPNVLSTSDGAATGVLSEVSPLIINAVWTLFDPPICYRLVDCAGIQAPIVTSLDLGAILGFAVNICINQAYPNDGPCSPVSGCWIVELSPTCQGAMGPDQIQVTNAFVDCIACQPVCYRLVDCAGLVPDIITDEDLSQYVGQVVQLEDCGDTCWRVVTGPCTTVQPVNPILNTFPDCATCNPPPPPPPFELHPRKIKPGYGTPGCPPEYTEKVNCAFGEAMFDEVMYKRYGITPCCDDETEKWIIKKELLDLKALYDPNLCKSSLVDCCPPCNVEAEIQIFTPTACPPPEDVQAEISLIPPPCPNPDGLQQPAIILT